MILGSYPDPANCISNYSDLPSRRKCLPGHFLVIALYSSKLKNQLLRAQESHYLIISPLLTLIHSFIHSDHFYSASSSPLLHRSAPDTARRLCRSFTPKRHRQL